MIFHQLVLLRGAVDSNEPANAFLPGVFNHFPQNHILNAAAQHAATHEPGIEFPGIGAGFAADD